MTGYGGLGGDRSHPYRDCVVMGGDAKDASGKEEGEDPVR